MAISNIGRLLYLAAIGGSIYLLIELAWRGYTHWTMGVVGGICFVLLGSINKWAPLRSSLLAQATAGTLFVTSVELIAGIILNIWLHLAVWDYSNEPLNLYGQICVPYMLLWFPLSFAAIMLYAWLNYLLFRSDRPRFRFI